jgi:hypothetical protein
VASPLDLCLRTSIINVAPTHALYRSFAKLVFAQLAGGVQRSSMLRKPG